ncbi:MAG: hypothetical protein ACM3SM_04000 [Bacteroidota bacterium]
MIIEEIKNIETSEKEIKKFAATVGIVLAVIAVLLLYFSRGSYIYFAGVSAFLLLFRFVWYKTLTPLYIFWMTLSVVLGWISTRIILTLLYYFVMTPIRMIAGISGKKFLELKPDPSKESYWILRNRKKSEPADFEKQF